MTPPSSRVQGTQTPPQAPETRSPTPDAGATASTSSPAFHHLEIRAGGRYGLGDAFQLEVGAAYRPLVPLVLGLGVQTNFTNRVSGSLEVGGRFRLSDAVSLQLTGLGGLGGFFGYPVRAGRLSEDSKLSGLFGFVGADLRLVVEPVRGFSFYIGLGYNHEFRGATTPSRQTLVSGEDPRGGDRQPRHPVLESGECAHRTGPNPLRSHLHRNPLHPARDLDGHDGRRPRRAGGASHCPA